jgi:hypothetical protein
MARRFSAVLMFLAMIVSTMAAAGQSAQPSAEKADRDSQMIAFGRAVVPLNGPWKFQIGDSPMDPATGKWIWAEPGFDDSKWKTMDLTPVPGIVDPWNGDPRWIPGWTAKGYPGYMGWAWYRLRVRIAERSGEQMAVNAPLQADDVFQFFANGEQIGSLGKFDSHGNVLATYFALPEMFLVPPAPVSTDAPGEAFRTVTFAYRFWMGPVGMTFGISPGGIHYAPLLVAAGSMDAQRRLDRNEMTVANIYPCFEGAAFLLLAMLAASVLLFDRSDAVYLWVAGALMVSVVGDALVTVMNFTHLVDAKVFFLLNSILVGPLFLGAWAMVWWVWFQLRRPAWVPKTIAMLTLVYLATATIASPVSYNYLPHAVWSGFQTVTVLVRLSFLLLLLLIVGLGIHKEGKEGWLVLPAVLAMVFTFFGPELTILRLGSVVHLFGITFFLDSLGGLFLVGVLGLLMLHRLRRSIKRQHKLALDVKQAQEVQQVILPQAHSSFPGLQIESEYRPAQEVGGDFFQILPNEKDGSLLIVAGDVTGKGLRAGMLVALLVGAVRSTVAFNTDPLVVLQELNKRLLGRNDAQATCLALRIEANGRATLVNAGHMAPYLNGEPLAMEGALPLGMIDGADFSVMHFKLNERDRLMLMSDGIAEATDANGKLFGFERVHELLRASSSAAEVAAAAQKFGQEDDISVISVTRTAELTPVVA